MKRETICFLTLKDEETLQILNFKDFQYYEEKIFIIARAINYVSKYDIEEIDRYENMKSVNIFLESDDNDDEYEENTPDIIGVESSEDSEETAKILAKYLNFMLVHIS